MRNCAVMRVCVSVKESSSKGGIMAEPTAMRAAFACTDEDYDRLGLNRDKVEAWEDGLRTDGSSGDYEWWYFDSHLEGGANLCLLYTSRCV